MVSRILKRVEENQDIGALIRTWRQERAFRIGRVLTAIGFFLGVVSTLVDLQFPDQLILYGDLVFLTGCFISLTLTRSEPGNPPYFLWWPAYIGLWLASLPTLCLSGGLESPFLGLYLTLYFLAPLIIQTEVKPIYLAGFVLLNLAGWAALEHLDLLPPPEPLASAFTVSTLAILGVSTIACALVFFKAEKELAQQIVQSYKALQETKARLGQEVAANSAKSELLANISHELRTSLGAMIGFADLAVDKNQNLEEKSEYAEIIRRNAREMARLIDDLLDLSKIEAGKIEVETIAFRPAELIKDVIELLSANAKKKGIEIFYQEIHPLPDQLKSDPFRIKQILVNLISNAIKFTDRGKVQILSEFEQDAHNTDGGKLHVRVIDTGCGLSSEEQTRLFKPFSQAGVNIARQYGGTGLGLHLARKLASLLGGELNLLSSERGIGSEFSFVCPVYKVSAVDLIDESKISRVNSENFRRLDRVNVLVVEDSTDYQKLLCTYLTSAGAKATCVCDGFGAINEALTGKFDAVIMDVQLPVIDGLCATKMLRQKGFDRPIIALTAHAMSGDKEQCRAAGCSAHLSKPIDPKLLVQTVGDHVKKSMSRSIEASFSVWR